MYSKTFASVLVLIFISCKSSDSQVKIQDSPHNIVPVNNDENPYATVAAIPAPEGFARYDTAANSFPQWLAGRKLKKDRIVHLYDGTEKKNQQAQFAVIDIPVGDKNLQQCADAVMRLRASYLYDQQKFDSIIFYDNEEKEYRFSKPYNEDNFNQYLQKVFGMCGTASLSKQLKQTKYKEIKPGDVLIRGGFPGHAVIVMDMIKNKNGEKKYMLAQSYMPAQEIHILLNPASENSPWYDLSDDETIKTPEYLFNASEWKRW